VGNTPLEAIHEKPSRIEQQEHDATSPEFKPQYTPTIIGHLTLKHLGILRILIVRPPIYCNIKIAVVNKNRDANRD